MKELTRTQLAVVKRTAQNVKGLRTKLAKIIDNIDSLTAEAMELNNTIEQFEAPIRTMTGGFTSEEVLNGTMNAVVSEIERLGTEAHQCDCACGENVKNEGENITENVNFTPEEVENNEFKVNVAPEASNEIPFI